DRGTGARRWRLAAGSGPLASAGSVTHSTTGDSGLTSGAAAASRVSRRRFRRPHRRRSPSSPSAVPAAELVVAVIDSPAKVWNIRFTRLAGHDSITAIQFTCA